MKISWDFVFSPTLNKIFFFQMAMIRFFFFFFATFLLQKSRFTDKKTIYTFFEKPLFLLLKNVFAQMFANYDKTCRKVPLYFMMFLLVT